MEERMNLLLLYVCVCNNAILQCIMAYYNLQQYIHCMYSEDTVVGNSFKNFCNPQYAVILPSPSPYRSTLYCVRLYLLVVSSISHHSLMIGLKRTVVRYYQIYTHQDYYQTVREGKRERERGRERGGGNCKYR